MSMPIHLDVVVIAERSDVAGIAASILRKDNVGSYTPRISAAFTKFSAEKSPFFIASEGHRLEIEIATSYLLFDVRRIDLWLALDPAAADSARTYIMHNGPTPNNFYRGAFPDPVVLCGFNTSAIPTIKPKFNEWLNSLEANLKPWRERIWEVFRDSS